MTPRDKTVCFSGHRIIPEYEKAGLIKRIEETVAALAGEGYTDFLAGGAVGFDTLASHTVLRMRTVFPFLRLNLLLPCRDQSERWPADDRAAYADILSRCDGYVYLADRYFPGCMQQRNRILADRSSVCICCMRSSSSVQPRGGTANTVGYCQRKGLRVINLADNN